MYRWYSVAGGSGTAYGEARRHSFRWFAVGCGFAGLLLFLTACDDRPRSEVSRPEPALPEHEVVARVGASVFTREALKLAGETSNGPGTEQQIIEQWVRFQVLLQRAKASGYDQDPEIVEQRERWLVAKFQEKELERRRNALSPISETEIVRYYDQHLDEYTTPAAVRAGVITFKRSSKATPEKQAELLHRAEAVHQQATGTDAPAYAELARRYSEDQATRYQGGDTGWILQGQPSARWEGCLVEAMFSLDRPGEVGPIVRGERALYILCLREKRLAGIQSLEAVRESISYRLTRQRDAQIEEDFLSELSRGLDVEVKPLRSSPAPVAADSPKAPPSLPSG